LIEVVGDGLNLGDELIHRLVRQNLDGERGDLVGEPVNAVKVRARILEGDFAPLLASDKRILVVLKDALILSFESVKYSFVGHSGCWLSV
jgi:hypothetical protein